jgi:hypothetical protein
LTELACLTKGIEVEESLHAGGGAMHILTGKGRPCVANEKGNAPYRNYRSSCVENKREKHSLQKLQIILC